MPADRIKLTKRTVDAVQASEKRYEIWDSDLSGFGLRVEPSGSRSFVVRYRPGAGGRTAPKRFVNIGRYGESLTADQARAKAKSVLSAVARGEDPAAERATHRAGLSVAALMKIFLSDHVEAKRKPSTVALYRHVLDAYLVPDLGTKKAADITRGDVARIHTRLKAKPFLANRMLAVAGSMFSWAGEHGYLPEGFNPTVKIERYPEGRRERFLSSAELEGLGRALIEAETTGIPWAPSENTARSKHVPREENRFVRFDPTVTAAIRLLLFTGARLREILHLDWQFVDMERGLLFLPDSKTGRKTVILNAPAMAVLACLPRSGRFVIPGSSASINNEGVKVEKARSDLKRPWSAISARAGLARVRLHDLRHTHASFGAGAGLGLPIIGKLLGHTQSVTTARYAHLDNDPLRRASEQIGGALAAALDGTKGALLPMKQRRNDG